MKIVTVLGSPRAKGNSATIARRFLNAAEARGAASLGVFELNRMQYRGCQACYACKNGAERCVLKDDLAAALGAVEAADVLVLATPVYYGDVTSQLKGFVDRLYGVLVPDFHTNPRPSRLSDKKLVFIQVQGRADAAAFGDIYPRYSAFMQRMGFGDCRLIRACGIGPGAVDAVPEATLREAESLAAALC